MSEGRRGQIQNGAGGSPAGRPSVKRLGWRIERAWDRSDSQLVDQLVRRMMDIACEGPSEQSVEAIEWLAARDGGLIAQHVRESLWRQPQKVFALIKALRELARTGPDRSIRRQAETALKRYGMDDATLASEE